MNRRAASLPAILALIAFVFAQALAAVYACEMGAPAHAAAVADIQAADRDCCDPAVRMDPACDNHCQQASKAPERVHHSPAPSVSAAILAADPAVVIPTIAPPVHRLRAPDLARHIAPPIPIRNCCFRI